MKNGKILDSKFSKSPILIISSELKKKKKLSKFKSINENEVIGLPSLMKSYKAKALFLRPDRFIFQSYKAKKDFNKFIKNLNNFLIE